MTTQYPASPLLESKVLPLFGGALSAAIPSRFVDVSDFKPIADTQEVFLDSETDQCIIFDILQYQSNISDQESAKFFFHNIAEELNQSSDFCPVHEVIQLTSNDMPTLPSEVFKSFCIGQQRVSKYKQAELARNLVTLYLANVRLPAKATDIVITLTDPEEISPFSASARATPLCKKVSNAREINKEVFATILRTFTINDWSLFDA